MTISLPSAPSASIGLRVFTLLLACIVMVSISWVELPDSHKVVRGPSADLQQATETDLDEIRNDVTATRPLDVPVAESVTSHPSLTRPIPLASQANSLPNERLFSKLSVYRL